MARFSLTSRCAVCGKEVAQSGPARQWVHSNEFYAKADHPADPVGTPYTAPKRTVAPAPVKKDAPKPKAKQDGDRPRSLADLRRRLAQGTAEMSAEDSASRRRRIAAMEAAAGQPGPSEDDLAARKLRLMRLQAAVEEDRKR